jgi:hypothetical protein
MARGTVIGEPVVSQANTDAFREGYDKALGDRKVERGRWVYDVRQGGLVPADEYVPPARALDAPIMVDRFYEGAKATDGTDIGSRRKHRAYMKEHGLTTADDFGSEWKKAQARREAIKNGEMPSKTRREVLERVWHDKFQK